MFKAISLDWRILHLLSKIKVGKNFYTGLEMLFDTILKLGKALIPAITIGLIVCFFSSSMGILIFGSCKIQVGR